MIARLTGTLAEASSDSAVIDVAGVGYLVQLSGRTLAALGPLGGDITILTELQVREDAWTLFGFGSTAERDAFRGLTSIQGVGGRLALAILSGSQSATASPARSAPAAPSRCKRGGRPNASKSKACRKNGPAPPTAGKRRPIISARSAARPCITAAATSPM